MTLGQPTTTREPAANDQAADRPSRNIVMHGNELDSRDIFRAAREVVIAHGEERYRLRLTAQNKLILTK